MSTAEQRLIYSLIGAGKGANFAAMTYLDFDRLSAISAAEFQSQDPYPWVNPEGALTAAGYEALRTSLPEVALFDRQFDKTRKFGQQSHDRFTLEYEPGCPLSPAWQGFIEELQGKAYKNFLKRMFGTGALEFRFHWHYTPNGCSVSPHCDSKIKLGSHIFYFNTAEDWDPAWGGETLVLDDKGRFPRKSAPKFEDFDRAVQSEALGNRSFIFMSRENSWHGVRPINCPEGKLRKVFIVVVNRVKPIERLRRAIGLEPVRVEA